MDATSARGILPVVIRFRGCGNLDFWVNHPGALSKKEPMRIRAWGNHLLVASLKEQGGSHVCHAPQARDSGHVLARPLRRVG
eukprot:3887523-Pyramimonas_sp.AAC.1